MTVRILDGDVRDRLRDLPDASVQCCVTSPPYYGLRDYGVPGQIGLEPTLAEYIANMVAVFREVRRVLRDDGTLWLNIGDSYGSGTIGRNDTTPDALARRAALYGTGQQAGSMVGSQGSRPREATLKPKDLMMVPARLAIALQEPYYVGKIKRIDDRVWLAAMVDAEGGMYIHKRKAGQHAGDGYLRQTDNYSPGLEVCNTHKAIVDRCAEITGVGSISVHTEGRRQPLYRWHVRSQQCRDLTREIYPYLIGKQHQARLIIGCPTTGKDAAAAHEALTLLHRGSEVIVDFRIPESLYDPGWFLRSDIVWAKPNPMPESVTDRPTSAHEHIFLLTKRKTYYYDADAIQEEAISGTDLGLLRGRSFADGANVSWHAASIKKRQEEGVDSRAAGTGFRNCRNVWTIATKPFSGAALVADYVGPDGKPYKVSPDCPVHGLPEYRPSRQTVVRDGLQGHRSNGKHSTDDRLVLEQQDEPSAIALMTSCTTDEGSTFGRIPQSNPDRRTPGQLPCSEHEQGDDGGSAYRTSRTIDQSTPLACSSDSPSLSCAETASPHSTQSHRTDHALATTQPCTASVQTARHTDGTSVLPGFGELFDHMPANSISQDDSGARPSAQTRPRISGSSSRHQPPECNCTIVSVDHFATFPPELPRRCILAGSREGDTVLDPFLGSGTTLLVADRLGREGIGIELNPTYAAMARRRIEADCPMFAEVCA